MNKRFLTRTITLMMILIICTMSVLASEERVISARPSLSFDGTTAVCYVDCRGNSTKDSIEATLTLYQGSNYVESWSDSGKGRVSISEKCTVKRGKNYRLVVEFSVNGEKMPSVYTNKTCP